MASKDNEMNGIAEQPKSDGDPTWKFWKKRRYVVVFMAFFGFFNVYALRVNLSVAIVAMTEIREVTLENGTTIQTQDFNWSSTQQGIILSSFFYGYILTQFAGGLLANKLGGHRLFGWGIGLTAILTLLTPIACKTGLWLLIVVRIIEGIFEGVTFPCIHAVWSRWAPKYERSRMATIAFAGNYAGTVISMPLSGVFAVKWGWESVFYVFGVIGCIWLILWVWIVKEGPEFDSKISKEELEYIQGSIGDSSKMRNIKHPWKEIFKSPAVWAIVASHFSENWGFYTLLTNLPKFLKESLNFQLEKTGFISAIPYLTMGILLGVAGFLADWTQLKGWLTTTQVRRYFNCGAFVAQTVCMVLVAYLLDPTLSVVFISIGVGLGAFAWSGFAVNHLDVAPRHSSVLMGISNTVATIPGIVSPMLTGYIVDNGADPRVSWQTVFYIASGIYLFGCVIYWFFASGEVQPWAIAAEKEDMARQELEELKEKEKENNSKPPIKGYANDSLELNEH